MDAEVEEIRQLKIQTQPDFQHGWECYINSDLIGAKASFEKLLTVNPTDKTAKLYLQRIEILLEKGLPENWNGVWALTEK